MICGNPEINEEKTQGTSWELNFILSTGGTRANMTEAMRDK